MPFRDSRRGEHVSLRGICPGNSERLICNQAERRASRLTLAWRGILRIRRWLLARPCGHVNCVPIPRKSV